jgi:DUF1680 family protein
MRKTGQTRVWPLLHANPSPSLICATMLSVTFFVSRLHRSAKSGNVFTKRRAMKRFDPARRELLKSGGLAAVGFALAGRSAAALEAGDSAPLSELSYAQVRLAEGPLARQAQENHRFVLALDEDGLLYPFRKRAGQAAPGSDMGGWYGADAFAPGATFGQWLAALARYHAIDNDAATREKVERLVRGYAATIGAGFYENNRFPSYDFDKLTLGLIDAKQYAGNRDALSALRHTTQAAVPFLPPRAMPRMEHEHAAQEDFSGHVLDESYTIPEYQFLAWKLTGDAQHHRLAERFLYDDLLLPLARGENTLPGKHAYSHVNCLSSAAQAYLSLGRRAYLDAARQGFAFVDAQSFATGGWGPDEHFFEPGSGRLGESLTAEHKSFETPCGAFAHFKLTRYLLRITRDARYGDSMERVLYNTVLGAKPVQSDGRAFYYSDYTRQARKTLHPDHWPCCSGTLPLVAADYRISTCFTDARGIYVNLYVPAQIEWRQGNAHCGLIIETDYPYASAITMRVRVPTPQTLTMNLRIPAWARGVRVAVNGKDFGVPVEAGTFAAIHREWRNDDRIELEIPLPLRLQAVDAEHPNTVALLAGPLVLMRVLDRDAPAPVSRDALLSARQSGDREWRLAGDREHGVLRAFPDIGDETYTTYQDIAQARSPVSPG